MIPNNRSGRPVPHPSRDVMMGEAAQLDAIAAR